MSRSQLYGFVVLLGMLGATEGLAQRQGGRTDGPENSEWGHGGYSRSTVGYFSVAVDWGANFAVKKSTASGTPLYVGGTGSYWITDWALMGVHLNYAFNTERFMALIGPTFRTDTWIMSFHASCKAGLAHDGRDKNSRFAISPQLGVDMVIIRHLLIGLLGVWDLPIGKGKMPSQIRVGLNLGWRF
ncbi:MAG: hypothetical protein FWD46_03730 [Cystobacterineae bacterium]|nr:hypothetical protein [Cystobacterineae bacterium]